MSAERSFPPLAPFDRWLDQPDVIGIMVDGYDKVYVEREGGFEDVPSPFRDNEHLMAVINEVAAAYGRTVDQCNPLFDARLSDGGRINAVAPPISVAGPALVIRKLRTTPLTAEDLIRFGSWNEDMITLLRACVHARLNMVVAGGTASGKTTVQNLIASMIPQNERVIVIQHASELALSHKYLVTLETRPPNLEGQGAVNMKDLVENALRMRPDRIIVSELLGGMAGSDQAFLDLISAMNRGHDGTLLNVHASSLHDVLTRMEMMATSANPSLPLLNLRQQIASSVDVITYQERLRDGTRKVTKVAEVVGTQGDAIALQDIFEFRQTGMEGDKIAGHFTPTGYIPRFLDRVQAAGIDLSLDFFKPR